MDQLTENSELGAPKLPRSTVPGVWQSRLDLRVSQNTAALLSERISGLSSSTGTSILLARFLGRERPGQYGAVYVCLSPYGSSAKFCLEQIFLRETKVRRHQAAEIFDTMTLTFLGFSLAGSILALLHAPLFGYSGPLRWPLGPALAVAFSLVLHHFFLVDIPDEFARLPSWCPAHRSD